MRMAYEPKPVFGVGRAPQIVSATGLGSKSQVYVDSDSGDGWGRILIRAPNTGNGPGNIVLNYPDGAPPTMFYGVSSRFALFTVTGQGTATHTLAWLGSTFTGGIQHTISYEWAVSQ